MTRTRSSRPANDLRQYVILKHWQAGLYGFLLFVSGLLAGLGIGAMPTANAQPYLECHSAPFVGSWCDGDYWTDNSYNHCNAFFGQMVCSRVCPIEGNPVNPPQTDYDPRTLCGAIEPGFVA